MYEIDRAHVDACTKPIAACPMCSDAYRLERVDQLTAEIVGLSNEIDQRRAAIDRLMGASRDRCFT